MQQPMNDGYGKNLQNINTQNVRSFDFFLYD